MKLALKRLSRSDLTFIEPLFRTLNAGNQKSINLNADVFIDEMYPGAPEAAQALDDEIPIKLSIFGPGAAGEYKLCRFLTRSAFGRWRLGDELVHEPAGELGRFSAMAEGDLAIMAFKGEPAPFALRLILLARACADDSAIHAGLIPLVADRSMVVLETSTLTATTAKQPAHPAARLLHWENKCGRDDELVRALAVETRLRRT